MNAKFQIGDHVRNSGKTKVAYQSGTIYGIREPNSFMEKGISKWGLEYTLGVRKYGNDWDRLFPGWRSKPIYLVHLDEPSSGIFGSVRLQTDLSFTEDDLVLLPKIKTNEFSAN